MAITDLIFLDNNSDFIPNLSRLSREEKRFYLNLSAITVFKQSPTGPMPVSVNGENELPFTTKSRQDVLKLATFYSVAVGQGSCYSRGLFGPLPVLNSDFRCLLFANTVKDPEQMDPRMDGCVYLITCFFYHSTLESVISRKREWIEQLFQNYFQSRVHIDEVIRDLSLLKKSIICFLW
ncbi:MAG: hypothetical protein ACFFD4_33670 [Candidatus Odinarchaeota archaeon]